MDSLNKLKKFNAVRSAIGFIVVGLILTALAIFIQFQPSKETANVKATITDIKITGSMDSEEHIVKVSYVVDGKEYLTELGAYESGWKVGDVIECKYDVDDPSLIMYGDANVIVIVVLVAGIAAIVFGVYLLINKAKKPSSEYSQYNRISEADIDQNKKEEIESNTESRQNYVFHFCGKLNQSYVMKDGFGNEVFKADCGGITLVKETDFSFVNVKTGKSVLRKVGHTVTSTLGGDSLMFANVESSFKIDGESCWNFLKDMGYGFDFSLNGIASHYEVKHHGVSVGSVELAGTEVMNDKYKDNALAKIPTNGIFKISCQPSEVEGFFYVCFCITRTEASLN